MGPEGPRGPTGVRGPVGPSGINGLILTEEYLNDEDYRDDVASYVIVDSRIKFSTIVGIYIKLHYTNTGDTYYMTLNEWAKSEGIEDEFLYQIIDPGFTIRLIDPLKRFNSQTIVVAIARP